MPATRWTTRGAGLAVAISTAALMLATEPSLAIVWDEGYTLGREARLRLWFRALVDPVRFADEWHPPVQELVQQVGPPPPGAGQIDTRAKLLFDPRVLAWFWPFAREEPHGHPPFYALVGLAGDIFTPGRADLARARLGPILVFSFTAGVLYGFVAGRWGRWGRWAGAASAGAWVLQPHLFAFGHYATYDALLSALWVDALILFFLAVGEEPRRVPRWGWVAAFGLVAGLAADTKLTGWFVPLPCLVWVVLDRGRTRRGLLALFVGGIVALVTLYALNPPWWAEPIAGPVRFLASNLGRGETIRIKTMFLGSVVSTPDGSLPWYNTVVWTALVTPVGFLGLALAGTVRALKRWRVEPFGLLVAGHWAFLLALRALPHTPGHDGVRQFLPAFGVLAVLAGLGAASAVERWGRWGRGMIAAAILEGAVSLALLWPVPLSYFSPVVGGLPGAAALGMEPTYYWDSLSGEALGWLRGHTGAGQKVQFATFPTTWLYLRDRGELPRGLLPNDPGVWSWYVVQNRTGEFRPLERALVRRNEPAFVVRKFGVPLLWVFPYEQVEAFRRESGASGSREQPRPADVPGFRGPAGLSWSAFRREGQGSQTLVRRLARGVGGLRGRVVDRGGLVGDRGAGRGGLLVAEPAEALEFGHLGHLERHVVFLRRGARRNRLADRDRRRAGGGHHDRLTRRGAGRLFLVTGPRVRRRERTEEAGQGEGQEGTTHGDCSEIVARVRKHEFTQIRLSGEFGQFMCPARTVRIVEFRWFAKGFFAIARNSHRASVGTGRTAKVGGRSTLQGVRGGGFSRPHSLSCRTPPGGFAKFVPRLTVERGRTEAVGWPRIPPKLTLEIARVSARGVS